MATHGAWPRLADALVAARVVARAPRLPRPGDPPAWVPIAVHGPGPPPASMPDTAGLRIVDGDNVVADLGDDAGLLGFADAVVRVEGLSGTSTLLVAMVPEGPGGRPTDDDLTAAIAMLAPEAFVGDDELARMTIERGTDDGALRSVLGTILAACGTSHREALARRPHGGEAGSAWVVPAAPGSLAAALAGRAADRAGPRTRMRCGEYHPRVRTSWSAIEDQVMAWNPLDAATSATLAAVRSRRAREWVLAWLRGKDGDEALAERARTEWGMDAVGGGRRAR